MSHGVIALEAYGFDFTVSRLVLGLFSGMVYGLLAVGFVLVFRASRFINLAQGSIGVFGAAIVGVLAGKQLLPYWLAFPLGMLAGAAAAGLTEAGLIRRLKDAPRLIGMVVTLGLGSFLVVAALIINKDNASGVSFPKPTGMPHIEIGDTVLADAYVAMLLLTPVLFIALALFLKRSRYGLAIRAAADNSDAASLAGVSAPRMVTLSWAIAGAIAAFSATLVWPTQGSVTIEALGPSLLLKGLAGAVIARFSNLVVAFLSSLVLGVIEQILISRSASDGTVELVLAIIIIGALLLQPRLARRDEDRGDWSRLAPAPLPSAYQRVFAIRHMDKVFALIFFAVLIAFSLQVTNAQATLLTAVAAFTIVAMSVSIVTGLAGQLSLGQFAFAGIGAAVSVNTVNQTGNFWLGIVAGCAAAGVTAALVGVPALRLRGLALSVSTLAFALATTQWLLRQDFLLGEGVSPVQPIIGDYSFEDGKNYFLLALVFLALALVITRNIRRSGFGRVLISLRDNEDAARALTIQASRRKLQVYALSGAMAGLGGAVFGHSLTQLNNSAFPAATSIQVVTSSAVGGLGTLFGPVFGSLYVKGVPDYLGFGTIALAGLTLSWLVLIVVAPSGIGGLVASVRRRIADIFARAAGIDPTKARIADAGGEAGDRGIRMLDLTGLPAVTGSVRTPVLEPPGPATPPILQIRGLSKSYGGVQAVRDVDLTVRQGEILGIIGPNGAGKTTMFEMVAGYVKPDAGAVLFAGRDVTSRSPEVRASMGLVRSFQSARLFPTMTVLDTVAVAQERNGRTKITSSILGLGRAEKAKYAKARDLIDLMGLGHLAYKPVGELSTGMRRMVELTSLLALDPTVLLLDEPAGGIAQSEGDVLVELFSTVRRDLGTTLVVIEHDLPLLFRLADRLIAMELGGVIAEGSPQEVRNHPDVVRSYLGGEVAAVERSGVLAMSGAPAASNGHEMPVPPPPPPPEYLPPVPPAHVAPAPPPYLPPALPTHLPPAPAAAPPVVPTHVPQSTSTAWQDVTVRRPVAPPPHGDVPSVAAPALHYEQASTTILPGVPVARTYRDPAYDPLTDPVPPQ